MKNAFAYEAACDQVPLQSDESGIPGSKESRRLNKSEATAHDPCMMIAY